MERGVACVYCRVDGNTHVNCLSFCIASAYSVFERNCVSLRTLCSELEQLNYAVFLNRYTRLPGRYISRHRTQPELGTQTSTPCTSGVRVRQIRAVSDKCASVVHCNS
jgi:hypothetical protein